MTNDIQKKFSDITEIFASDGYTFLKIRSALERFEEEAKNGNEYSAQLVEVFNRFHRLCMCLK